MSPAGPAYTLHGVLLDLVWHVGHYNSRLKQEHQTKLDGGLGVQQVVPPVLGHELRHDDRDGRVRMT